MQMIPCLDLADAEAIVSSAMQEAERSASRVSIAVVDGSGLLIRFSRMDGASAASVEAAAAKARTAALTGNDSAAAIASGRLALLSLQGVLHQPCALMSGGLVLRSQGIVVGAIGVSGMTPDQDASIARAGTDGFELRAQDYSS